MESIALRSVDALSTHLCPRAINSLVDSPSASVSPERKLSYNLVRYSFGNLDEASSSAVDPSSDESIFGGRELSEWLPT